VAEPLRERLKQYGEDAAARQLARASLPPWAKFATFLSFAVCFPAVFFTLFFACILLHSQLHPETYFGHLPGPGPGFMAFASLFAALPLSLMLANVVLWLIPPLHRAHETAFAGAPSASFKDGMRQLAIVALFVLPVCAVVAGIGIVDPWLH
jgi:hypothetical protein